MDIWHIRGGRRLSGSCRVQGSKNATLPILAASLVLPRRSELEGVPRLKDVDAALDILRHLGSRTWQQEGSVCIDSSGVSGWTVPRELMLKMRSSVIFMGALLARCGQARLSLPGGCQLGKRPIDLHLQALRQLGAQIEENGDEICCRSRGLRGAVIRFPFPSVGATENAMLAACGAEGETRIYGAAREPEILALQDYLQAAGVRIWGAGTDCVTVSGVSRTASVHCRIQPDRIVASTLACAAASAGGEIELRNVDPTHFSTVLHFLNQAGCDIITKQHCVTVRAEGKIKAVGPVVTAPYPGFPTDAQPVLMAALLRAEGITRMTETIFENRYRQADELNRLGADIRVSGRQAEIRGVERLHGGRLRATDLRGGASMVVAALGAQGETLVVDEGHIARGYEDLDGTLRSLGARVWVEKGEGNI